MGASPINFKSLNLIQLLQSYIFLRLNSKRIVEFYDYSTKKFYNFILRFDSTIFYY